MIVHYWTGYGSLCNTADARKRNSVSDRNRKAVTCASCLTLLGKLYDIDREIRAADSTNGEL